MSTPAELLATAAASLGITMSAEFVPFSQSRNAKPAMGRDKPWRSLNWRVTLERNGRAFITTDYAQGEGHAPAHKGSVAQFGGANSLMREQALNIEIEKGQRAIPMGQGFMPGKALPSPLLADVLYSLISDASVLDAGSFENWADEFGYDTDSRSAETTYRACLDIALKLRAAIGDAGIEALRVAGEDS